MNNAGPLRGVKVIEIAGLGPGPFCGMMLADMGAEVILVERKSINPNAAVTSDSSRGNKQEFYKRGKKSVVMDLKKPEAIEAVLTLLDSADVLIEGFRPGVMERLGLGPEVCLERNPRLVYGRMTGWGQSGPLAHAAGHDMNYIALSGALHYTGNAGEPPFAPATVVGDVAGGGMMLAYGIVCALLHARFCGEGQVIDAAIVDGASYMMTLMASMQASGFLPDARGESFFTAGSPWYNCYECADGNYITVGALEPDFYQLLIDKCGFTDDPDFSDQFDKSRWPAAKEKMAALFLSRNRDHWCELLEATDACFGPVLSLSEAASHPHNIARGNFIKIDGLLQPAPAPRFSRSAPKAGAVAALGQHTECVLKEYGLAESDLAALRENGAI